jgi:DNA-binding transcriptional ArsR family regulator
LTAPRMPSIELDPRTAYEFLMGACPDCGEPDDILPEDRDWLAKGRAAVLQAVGRTTSAESCVGFVTELTRLVVNRPDVTTARQVVEIVDGMSDEALVETLMGELIEYPELSEAARKAIHGDAQAYESLCSQLEHWKGHPVLPDDFADLAPTVRQALHTWLPIFEPVEARIGRILLRDVADRRLDEATADPMGFIERITNGIRMVPETRTRRIVLAPSYFGRPYNSLTKAGELTLICYPVEDAALGGAGRSIPPAGTVRLYRALGDETRLRILRLLAERDRYLTELATELDLSKPTISHHLAHLRSAGLVTLHEQGNLTYYTLRHDRIEAAGPELRAFLSH